MQLNHNLSTQIPSFIQQYVSLHDKNWFKTGGPARYFCEPQSAEEFQQGLIYAQCNQLSVVILGEGANVLISDTGFNGLVIRPALTTITIQQISNSLVHVAAGAGVTIHNLITFCLEHTILGLEEFSGIPGTIGGAVYINVHYFEFLLEHFLVSAEIIERETGKIHTVHKDWFMFGYNQSRLQEKNHFILSATFALRSGTTEEIAYARGRHREIIRHRSRRYPSSHTCGSFFRNFYEHEIAHAKAEKKVIYVGYYLDKLGIKGDLSVGDAVVSWQHANMIVNRGNATSTDIISLARTMQELVYERFGLLPQPECQFVGFTEYPLLK